MRFCTAGESHGALLVGIIEGLPAGLLVQVDVINKNLRERQSFFGRSSRMNLESDKIEITSGLYNGKTTGAPLALLLKNRSRDKVDFSIPRPGHADLPGYIKYKLSKLSLPAERASARGTAIITAIGTVAKLLLREIGVRVLGYVENIGGIWAGFNKGTIEHKEKILKKSELRCLDFKAEKEMKKKIKIARDEGDTLGGIAAVEIEEMPVGVGSYVNMESKLECRFAQMLMGIPSVKGIEIGQAFEFSQKFGSEVQDILEFKNKKIRYVPNNSAGIVGGMSTGEPIYMRMAVKPVPTLGKGVRSFNIKTGLAAKTFPLRADVCVVPSVGLIGEAVASWVSAAAILEKFPSDTLREFKEAVEIYRKKCWERIT